MRTRNCGNCAHWERAFEENSNLGLRRCRRIGREWECTDWDHQGIKRILKPEHKNDTAFVVDGSEYYAALITMESFCCSHHSEDKWMTDELKPCPFCGSDHPRIIGAYTAHKWVSCYECGAEIPSYGSRAKAVAAWNRRAGDDTPLQPPAEDE